MTDCTVHDDAQFRTPALKRVRCGVTTIRAAVRPAVAAGQNAGPLIVMDFMNSRAQPRSTMPKHYQNQSSM
jgi:hypothetical protein